MFDLPRFVVSGMKAGGTAVGIIELMKEFECNVVGIGVLIESGPTNKRLVENYMSIMKLEYINEETGEISIVPAYSI
jgi:purine operon repressor